MFLHRGHTSQVPQFSLFWCLCWVMQSSHNVATCVDVMQVCPNSCLHPVHTLKLFRIGHVKLCAGQAIGDACCRVGHACYDVVQHDI